MKAFATLALACIAAQPVLARAQDPVGADEAPTLLDEVLVSGEQPGPGLWKVIKQTADGEHVLWVLGSYGPLPKKMQWRSAQVEQVIAGSQEVLGPVSVDAKVGFWGGLMMAPSLIGIRDNPNDAKLKDVVPPELYARWLPLKARYIGKDDDAEKWRPIFAAGQLYLKAIEKSQLELNNKVWPVIEKLAKKNRVKINEPSLEIKVDKARSMVKDFKKAPLQDIECFAATLERVESDLDLMRVRANAWATGDLKTLRSLPHVDQVGACIAGVMSADVVQSRGFADVPARVNALWIKEAEASLARNRSTFTVMRMSEILKPDGLIAQLRAKGYQVEEP